MNKRLIPRFPMKTLIVTKSGLFMVSRALCVIRRYGENKTRKPHGTSEHADAIEIKRTRRSRPGTTTCCRSIATAVSYGVSPRF